MCLLLLPKNSPSSLLFKKTKMSSNSNNKFPPLPPKAVGIRCHPTTDPVYAKYHDEEWGVPIRGNDNKLFEYLTLEGAQAGLSWITVLKKREAYRKSFANFDPAIVAKFNPAKKVPQLMSNEGIIRNKLKIESTIINANAVLKVQKEFGSLDKFLWSFIPNNGKPIQPGFKELSQLPAKTVEAEAMSKALKKRGFKFVGPTIMYAFMQAVGMTNDHLTNCICFKKCGGGVVAANAANNNKKAKKDVVVGKKKSGVSKK